MQITPKDFIQKVLSQTRSITNVELAENFTQSAGSTSTQELTISDSTILDLTFPHVDYSGSLSFANCKIGTLELADGSSMVLQFEGCEIQQVKIHKNYINKRLRIANSTVHNLSFNVGETVYIEIVDSKLDQVETSCTIQAMELTNVTGSKKVNPSFKNPTPLYLDSLLIKNRISELKITNSNLINLAFDGYISNLKLVGVVVADKVKFSTRPQDIAIYDSEIHHFQSDLGFNTAFIYGSRFDSFKMRTTVAHFEVDRGKSTSHVDSSFGTLDLCESSHDRFVLHSTDVENLLMNNFSSKGADLLFVIVKKEFRFEHSNLKEATLHNINLSDAVIRFLNSSMAGSKLTNVEWPSQFYEFKPDLKMKSVRGKLNILWPLKEAYRQIKVLSLDQQNQIDALAFQKHELTIYWKIVNTKLWNWKHFRLRDLGNWVLLGTNRIFSDFGQSWTLPLLWLVGIHSIFFYLLLNNFDLGVKLDIRNAECEATGKGIAMFVNLLNPIHTTDLKYPWDDTTKVSIFGTIDFFMRILAAYFIYYFLKATRKFAVTSFS